MRNRIAENHTPSSDCEKLLSLSHELLGALHSEDVIDVASRFLYRVYDANLVIHMVYDPATRGLIKGIRAKEPPNEEFVKKARNDLARYIAQNSKIEISVAVSKEIDKKPAGEWIGADNAAQKKIGSAKLIPISLGGNLIGAFTLISTEKNLYKSAREDRLFRGVADMSAIALQKLHALFESHETKIGALIQSLSNGVIIFNKDLLVTLSNPMAARFTGLPAEGFRVREICKLFEPLKLENKIHRVLRKGEPLFFPEAKLSRSFYEIHVLPVRDADNEITGGALILHDITHIKEIDMMKTEFVSVASHQLRTPLTAIKLFVELLLQEQPESLSIKQADYIRDIGLSCERMIKLVNDLLNVSRLETGRLKIEPHTVDLEAFIEKIIHDISLLSESESSCFEFIRVAPPIGRISIDPGLLRQVIQNLLTNAIKYSPKKDSKIIVGLSREEGNNLSLHAARSEANKRYAVIRVKDNGIGIAPDARARVFEKFFRADNAQKIDSEGTGLGLYVARMIMRESGGDVWFDSTVGKGSTFYIALPMRGMKEKKGERGLVL